jgi:hypothetical protein
MNGFRANASIASCGVLVLSAAYGLARVADPARNVTVIAMLYLILAFGAAGGAALLWKRGDRFCIVVLVVVALGARLALLGSAPFFSLDAYRYVWDAQLIRNGIDPLVVAPSDPALSAFQTGALYRYIYWRDIPSLYPPLAYALFVAGTLLPGAGVLGIKAVLAVGDVGALTAVLVGLQKQRLPLGRAALYAWSPLVLIEFGWSGHVESWAVAGIVLATLAAPRAHAVCAGGMALAILTKLTPLVLLPVVFARNAAGLAATCAIVAAVYVPLLVHSHGSLGSLGAYAAHQQFNDTLFLLLRAPGAIAVLGLAVYACTSARYRGAPLVWCVIAIEVVFLAVAPNVLPWYLTIVVALLPLAAGAFAGPKRSFTLGLVGWTMSAPLAYGAPLVYAGGSLRDACVRAVEYAPVIVGGLYALYRSTKRRAVNAAFVAP